MGIKQLDLRIHSPRFASRYPSWKSARRITLQLDRLQRSIAMWHRLAIRSLIFVATSVVSLWRGTIGPSSCTMTSLGRGPGTLAWEGSPLYMRFKGGYETRVFMRLGAKGPPRACAQNAHEATVGYYAIDKVLTGRKILNCRLGRNGARCRETSCSQRRLGPSTKTLVSTAKTKSW